MNFREGFRAALDGLRANRMRAVLTTLGVIIGVAAVLIIVTIGEEAKAQMLNQIRGMGANLLFVAPGGGEGRARLTDDDGRAILERVQHVVAIAPQANNGGVSAKYHSRTAGITLVGSTSSWPQINNGKLTTGRFFTTGEERARARVAVLGSRVADRLFYGHPAVDEIVRINNVPFRVIGILEGRGGLIGNQDDQALVPLTTGRSLIFGGSRLDIFMVSAQQDANAQTVADDIMRLLRQRHRLKPTADDFQVISQTQILDKVAQVTTLLTAFLGSIALISLLVGGVGIMNVMYSSVSERTREIGIRRAVGARRRDIHAQFLIEAVVVSLAGGLIGMLIGTGVCAIVIAILHWEAIVPFYAIGVSLAFSVAVGVISGYYPARKAAHLDPIESLRYE